MTLCELVSSKYSDVPLIGLYEEGQEKIVPDFTDYIFLFQFSGFKQIQWHWHRIFQENST